MYSDIALQIAIKFNELPAEKYIRPSERKEKNF